MKAMAVFGRSFPRSSAAALGDVPEERARRRPRVARAQAGAERSAPTRCRRTGASTRSCRDCCARSPTRCSPAASASRAICAAAEHLRHAVPQRRRGRRRRRSPPTTSTPTAPPVPATPTPPSCGRRRSRRCAGSAARGHGRRPGLRRARLPDRARARRDEHERTELTRAAGEMALQAGRLEAALELFEAVAAAHLAAGREREAARRRRPHRPGAEPTGAQRPGDRADHRALQTLGADGLDAEVGAAARRPRPRAAVRGTRRAGRRHRWRRRCGSRRSWRFPTS